MEHIGRNLLLPQSDRHFYHLFPGFVFRTGHPESQTPQRRDFRSAGEARVILYNSLKARAIKPIVIKQFLLYFKRETHKRRVTHFIVNPVRRIDKNPIAFAAQKKGNIFVRPVCSSLRSIRIPGKHLPVPFGKRPEFLSESVHLLTRVENAALKKADCIPLFSNADRKHVKRLAMGSVSVIVKKNLSVLVQNLKRPGIFLNVKNQLFCFKFHRFAVIFLTDSCARPVRFKNHFRRMCRDFRCRGRPKSKKRRIQKINLNFQTHFRLSGRTQVDFRILNGPGEQFFQIMIIRLFDIEDRTIINFV
ncbi:hypothetical protein BMS3Bbin03_02012 [bacterium BMS3Bbin03]|nr:hypothetical protein BMS3Bbin03_02012 [bacterium BMS3Bbin03]